MIKAILLDLDNTLYEYEPCNNYAIKKVINFLSVMLKVPKEKILAAFNESREQVKKQLGNVASSHSRLLYLQKTIENFKGSTDPLLTLEAHNLFWKTYFSKMHLPQNVKEFLEFARRSKLKIAILTDMTAAIQFRKILHLGIEDYVDWIVTSEEAGEEKPSTPIFSLALKKLNYKSNECLVIGDHKDKDLVGAKKAGMKCEIISSALELSPSILSKYLIKPTSSFK